MPRPPSKRPTGHPNVFLSAHAVERMSDRGYTMADIDAMLGTIDPRLVVEVVTVLPRDNSRTRTAVSDARIKPLEKKLHAARRTLKQCTKKKAVQRWTEEVAQLQKAVTKARQCSNLGTMIADRCARRTLLDGRYLRACLVLTRAEFEIFSDRICSDVQLTTCVTNSCCVMTCTL